MRTLFFGTPEIAIPALRALAETTDLVGVVCQPDRPAGRGLELAEPAVKKAARELGLPVHQPAKVKTGDLDAWVREREAEVAVVLAYGRILPPAVLAAPRRGCMNLHASLLPRYRGAAPIQWAIIRGETETGISLMQMDEGLDTGPVYTERRVPVSDEDDAGTLAARLAELAAVVVREDLPRAVSGEIPAVAQDAAEATLAPPIQREDCRVDWSAPRKAIVDRVRGLAPRPGAFTMRAGRVLKLVAVAAGPSNGQGAGKAPGTVVRADRGGLWVACGDGVISIVRAQPEGKRVLSSGDLVNGRAVRLDDHLGS